MVGAKTAQRGFLVRGTKGELPTECCQVCFLHGLSLIWEFVNSVAFLVLYKGKFFWTGKPGMPAAV